VYKGVKSLGSLKRCDGNGDGIYEFGMTERRWAKKHMHKLTRTKAKRNIRKEVLYEKNNI
jgi:hypothetical protein